MFYLLEFFYLIFLYVFLFDYVFKVLDFFLDSLLFYDWLIQLLFDLFIQELGFFNRKCLLLLFLLS